VLPTSKAAGATAHQGELEAIVLAQELSAEFVVLNDLLARRKAQRLAINVIGTLGLLLLFKNI
jgi:predicted nucleic acid-binding protein